MIIAPGTQLGRYEIRSLIGAGGMGEVYLAQDTKLDRKVALKILPPEFAEDADRMSRFVREAKSASALNHPNIITIHEIGESDGTHFIATEFIEGETLHSNIKNQSLNLKSVLEMTIQVVSALDAAHRAGIVHRDIKPENVMIRPDGVVKILDFGIAKLSAPPVGANGSSEDATAIKPQSTSPGMVVGTANYMSPEQARGKKIDARSDIFSFGIVFYEMLTGRRAFEGETVLESISSILKDEPKQISQILPEVPGEIERIVNKTLRKDREERYQTAKDLLIDLKDAKHYLEFHNKLERTVSPEKAEPKTQILQATTLDEINQTTTNQTVSNDPKTKYLLIGLLSLIVLAGGFFGYKYLSPIRQIESIAVMPFVNASGNTEVEYLSDGMTETLINSLSQLPNLSVKARSSVFRYKGKEVEPQTVGSELSVQAILNGRVIQRGDNLILSLELVDARTGNQIWGEQYNRKMTDIVSLQTEIARDISNKLRAKLTGAEQQQVAKNYTVNPEAYQLYLQGRYHWNKRTVEGVNKATEYFQKAIEKDPTYALAYVGLADSYIVVPNLQRREVFPKAKAAALKALEIDESLGEAHAALANIGFYYEWNWANAEREYKRAIELSPNYATAHHWYGESLAGLGRFDESFTEYNRALELDPLSLAISTDLGMAYYYARQYDRAIEHLKKLIELDPNYVRTHFYLARVYEEKGMFEEAFAEREKGIILSGGNAEKVAREKIQITNALKTSGAKGYWQKLLDLTEESAQQKGESPNSLDMAVLYARLNKRHEAFEWLEKAYQERESLSFLNAESDWDNLRDDPRFQDLLRRVGLPQ
jgi:serine/threonine protein kinase/Tfp pilus assembly protein PilF